MMQQNDYIIGQSSAGTYTILETKNANEPVPAIMNTNAKEYQMTIGTWQLALLDNVIPVYVKQAQQQKEKENYLYKKVKIVLFLFVKKCR